MTVSNPTRAVTFTGNGVTTVFPYTFLIPEGTAVITLTDLTGDLEVESVPLTEGVDYTITGEDDEAGGSVTKLGAVLTSSFKINIKSIITPTQVLDLTNQSAYVPTQLENQLDKMTLVQLQHAEQLERALTLPSGTSTTTEEALASISAVSTFATAASASADAASASAFSASGSASAAAASAVLADAAADAAAASESAVAADRVTVAADKATVAADKATVAADKATTAANVVLTSADVVSTGADAAAAALDAADAETARAAAVVAQLAAEAASGGVTPVEDQVVAATAKATPVDADLLAAIETSGPTLKKTTFLQAWTNYFKAKADALYQPIAAVLTSLATLGGSLASGNIIYATAANTLARLATGTNGHVLTLAAGVPSWAAPSTGGMTLLGTITTTSGATQALTGIAAGYRELYLELEGVSSSSAFQLSVALSSTNGAAYGSDVNIMSSFSGSGSTAIDGVLRISNISSVVAAAKTWMVIFSSLVPSPNHGIISTNTAAVVNALRLSTNGGTFDAGSVRVYGVK